ncbi:transketolase [Caldicoprobacter guelmensis]|uniref:transketolase family protein n=1 Tax=Caldicoprobacter guelmensis TaxID=1170224 RepID=UPI001958018C|nr:transketolase C-terminal domain-containing protein [Caldicoprobacter guelmensis]MBM7583417.1 transketolase [Caldicoprobacter guelmensis]
MEQKPMRLVFGEILCELAEEFPEMVVLDADVSNSTQTKRFEEKFKDRFFNFGIAEANMVSAAAGMATCGLIPVVSTFAFLIVLRAGDPVRSLIAYNSLNVKLAGGYAGLSDFADGASHQSVTDLAIMRAMPNMTVLVPSDIDTTRGAVRAMLKHRGPVYLRLSREPVGSYHGGDESFEIGKAKILKDGKDVTLAVSGTLLPQVLEAAEELEKAGIRPAVLEFPTLKPFDSETLIYYAQKTGAIVTVEEHTILGGFGGAVSESLSEICPVPVKRIGINDCFGESATSYSELLNKYFLTKGYICQAAIGLIKRKK